MQTKQQLNWLPFNQDHLTFNLIDLYSYSISKTHIKYNKNICENSLKYRLNNNKHEPIQSRLLDYRSLLLTVGHVYSIQNWPGFNIYIMFAEQFLFVIFTFLGYEYSIYNKFL